MGCICVPKRDPDGYLREGIEVVVGGGEGRHGGDAHGAAEEGVAEGGVGVVAEVAGEVEGGGGGREVQGVDGVVAVEVAVGAGQGVGPQQRGLGGARVAQQIVAVLHARVHGRQLH